MAPTSVATPFGINDILSRTVTAEVSEENFYENRSIEDLKFNQTPNSAATMATFENGFGCRSAAVAARAAAMFFNNNHGIGCHGNQQGQMKFTGKPLTDLPGRPPIYWPGVLTEDWQEKVGISGWLKKNIVEVLSFNCKIVLSFLIKIQMFVLFCFVK